MERGSKSEPGSHSPPMCKPSLFVEEAAEQDGADEHVQSRGDEDEDQECARHGGRQMRKEVVLDRGVGTGLFGEGAWS